MRITFDQNQITLEIVVFKLHLSFFFLISDSQANTSHHLANEDDKTPNNDNDSNQFSIPQSRPKRNLLINSKRPKSEYGPSPVMSNSKRIVKQSLKAAVRKQVECDNCNKTFSKQSHLNRHLLTTSCANQNTPQFMCEICGKSLIVHDVDNSLNL